MRVEMRAGDLRPGMEVFLPYYGRLLKSKVKGVGKPFRGSLLLTYEVLSEGEPRGRYACVAKVGSKYEVYRRPNR